MKTINSISDAVFMLLQRVRARSVGMDRVERELEVKVRDLQQVGNVPSPSCVGLSFGYKEALALRRDIDARTIKR